MKTYHNNSNQNHIQSANTQTDPLIIGIVAGEFSGDSLGADFMQQMNNLRDDIFWIGVGGKKMQAQGLHSVFELDRLAVMGLVEIVSHLRDLFRARDDLIEAFKRHNIQWYIGIDAPDFNLRVAKKLKPKGVFCVQYVSPSIWAWRESRIYDIMDATHLVLCLFPFELEIYTRYGHPAVCVGHPLVDSIPDKLLTQSIEKQRRQLIWENKSLLDFFNSKDSEISQLICVMPGSRRGEIKYILPPMLEAIGKLLQIDERLCFVIPTLDKNHRNLIEDMVSSQEQYIIDAIAIAYEDEQSNPNFSLSVMAACDIIVLSSGTATLEAMLLNRPMIVVYKMNQLSFAVISRLIKVPYVALPNILAHKKIVPELIQKEATGDAICQAVSRLLQARAYQLQLQHLKHTSQSLRQQSSQSPAHAVVQAWLEL